MADSKYGRLYTDSDLRKLAEKMLGNRPMGPDIFAEAMHDLEGSFTFPPDEPLFLLRGQDSEAAFVARGYAMRCAERGIAFDHHEAARRAANAMRDWQLANPTRVKVPD